MNDKIRQKIRQIMHLALLYLVETMDVWNQNCEGKGGYGEGDDVTNIVSVNVTMFWETGSDFLKTEVCLEIRCRRRHPLPAPLP